MAKMSRLKQAVTFDLLPINGVNKNSITASSLKYRYKEKGAATWGTWANIPFTVTDDGFAGSNQFISLDNTKEFEFEFQVADKFGTVNQATELGAGTPIMFAGRYSNGDSAVGINKVPENGVLDVAGDIYSNGVKVVPFADGIVEYEVTPTYSYYKYASGRCVQTIIRSYTGTVSTLWNGMRISSSISSATLPVALSSITSVHTGVNCPTYNVWLMTSGATTTTVTGAIYLVSPENITSSRTYQIYTTVEGILP